MYKKLMMILIVLYASVSIYFQLTSGPKSSNHHALANDRTKIEDIKRLLNFTCSDEIVMEIIDDMICNFRASRPEIQDSLWEELFLEINPNEIIGMIITIYDKYFTHDDIRAFIQFYESPAGERYRKLMPDILKESAYLGIRYGEEIAKRIMKRLKYTGKCVMLLDLKDPEKNLATNLILIRCTNRGKRFKKTKIRTCEKNTKNVSFF